MTELLFLENNVAKKRDRLGRRVENRQLSNTKYFKTTCSLITCKIAINEIKSCLGYMHWLVNNLTFFYTICRIRVNIIGNG